MASKLKIFTVKQLGRKDNTGFPSITQTPPETNDDLMNKIITIINDGSGPGPLINWHIVKMDKVQSGSGDASYFIVVEGD